MRVITSRISQSGHVVIIRIPEGSAFEGSFVDEAEVRDLTDFSANLLLAGAIDSVEAQADGRPEPVESIEAAAISYRAPLPTLGQVLEAPTFTWAHLPSGTAEDFPATAVLGLLARGLSAELTSGVAAETGEAPEDLSGLGDLT